MISSTFTYNGCKPVLHTQNTRVKLDEPSILLIENDIEFLDSIKGYLNKSFSIKDLGEAAYILGIKIYTDRSRRLIGLHKAHTLIKF